MKGLVPSSAVMFLCDIQERFRPLSYRFPELIKASNRMNPEKLGTTIQELDIAHAELKMAKMKFSMVTPKVDLWLRERPSKKSVILFGIETHVCVLQTAMDLLQGGWEVTVISDATSSRNSNDRKEAIDQLRTWGASVVSSEAVLLSMLKSADHEKFRQISSLVKEIISEKVHL